MLQVKLVRVYRMTRERPISLTRTVEMPTAPCVGLVVLGASSPPFTANMVQYDVSTAQFVAREDVRIAPDLRTLHITVNQHLGNGWTVTEDM